MNVVNRVSGIIIVAIIIWVITTFGITIYEVYERSAVSHCVLTLLIMTLDTHSSHKSLLSLYCTASLPRTLISKRHLREILGL